MTVCAALLSTAAAAQRDTQCPSERGIYSQNSNSQTRLTIVNDASFPIRLFWLDFNGLRVLFGTLYPGQTLSPNTFASHPWIITDLANNCRQVVFAGSENQVYRYTGAGRSPAYAPHQPHGPDTIEPLTERDAQRQIDLPIGQPIVIALPSNARPAIIGAPRSRTT